MGKQKDVCPPYTAMVYEPVFLVAIAVSLTFSAFLTVFFTFLALSATCTVMSATIPTSSRIASTTFPFLTLSTKLTTLSGLQLEYITMTWQMQETTDLKLSYHFG